MSEKPLVDVDVIVRVIHANETVVRVSISAHHNDFWHLQSTTTIDSKYIGQFGRTTYNVMVALGLKPTSLTVQVNTIVAKQHPEMQLQSWFYSVSDFVGDEAGYIKEARQYRVVFEKGQDL
jgi:hypothetical protein